MLLQETHGLFLCLTSRWMDPESRLCFCPLPFTFAFAFTFAKSLSPSSSLSLCLFVFIFGLSLSFPQGLFLPTDLCLVLSYLVLPCLALPCLILFCLGVTSYLLTPVLPLFPCMQKNYICQAGDVGFIVRFLFFSFDFPRAIYVFIAPLSPSLNKQNKTNKDNTSQDQTRHRKSRQDKTRHDRQDQTGSDQTRQGQDKT